MFPNPGAVVTPNRETQCSQGSGHGRTGILDWFSSWIPARWFSPIETHSSNEVEKAEQGNSTKPPRLAAVVRKLRIDFWI